MIKRIAIRKDWTISMSEFRKLAEKYQWEIAELEEENKKLKEEIENHKQNIMQDELEIIPKLEEENKKLKLENAKLKDRIITDENFEEKLDKENKKLKEDVDYFRQCYLDLKKLCEKEWFMLSDEKITKMFNLDKIR